MMYSICKRHPLSYVVQMFVWLLSLYNTIEWDVFLFLCKITNLLNYSLKYTSSPKSDIRFTDAVISSALTRVSLAKASTPLR